MFLLAIKNCGISLLESLGQKENCIFTRFLKIVGLVS